MMELPEFFSEMWVLIERKITEEYFYTYILVNICIQIRTICFVQDR